ncbi:MAG: thymidine kinase [Spirochaetota bacterium]|nr:MAG: thymidine kinase [Spirochaetota bacterium]
MAVVDSDEQTKNFLKSLGFPYLKIHHAINHYDFTKGDRKILIIGPMGSGKTEFSARIYRDSLIALKKSEKLRGLTMAGEADRRNIFYIRSKIDKKRFEDYPEDALAYRSGYERLGNCVASIEDSFELEKILDEECKVGTWILDEAEFFDERIAYVIDNFSSKKNGINFIFPMLIINFRKDIFNRTARLLMEIATDVFPLTAYCEHPECIADSYYTYRYYTIGGVECPALYFDPLIIVGGDKTLDDSKTPNYSTRCDHHHFLPGKEYTFLTLRPLGELAYSGNVDPLLNELMYIKNDIKKSEIYKKFAQKFLNTDSPNPIMMNALKVKCIAEKALIYLFSEENLLSIQQMRELAEKIDADLDYINDRLLESRRIKL